MNVLYVLLYIHDVLPIFFYRWRKKSEFFFAMFKKSQSYGFPQRFPQWFGKSGLLDANLGPWKVPGAWLAWLELPGYAVSNDSQRLNHRSSHHNERESRLIDNSKIYILNSIANQFNNFILATTSIIFHPSLLCSTWSKPRSSVTLAQVGMVFRFLYLPIGNLAFSRLFDFFLAFVSFF